MDDTQQTWKWADVGSRRMPRSPLTYPTLMVDDENGSQYDTVYVFVDNRALSGTNPPEYWPYLAPWIKGRCEVIGPYQEKTTAIHIPINSDTGFHQVHYTWAGAAVLEALCLQGRPQLRLQKSYQFQVPKTNPKTSPLYLLVSIMTIFPFLLC